MTPDQSNIAIYWDFENIHASILDRKEGNGAYQKSRFKTQESLVDIDAIMEFAASIGSVSINRAYGNWQWFSKYRETLLHNAVELIQLFPPGASAKNGADIKLCLDATEDIIRFSHITTILVVGGDSDFMPVSQKIKAAGKTLVGIGCEGSTNKHWAHSCHEFRYYEKLLIDEALPEVPKKVDKENENSPPDATILIRRAIARLSQNKGDPWVLKSGIRPMIKRLDPTFDEKTYGVATFAELLSKHGDIFEVKKGEHDQVCRIKSTAI